MIAIVKTGGKQYAVEPNKTIRIEKLIGKEVGDTVTFEDVLLVAEGANVTVGKPTVAGATVTGKVLKQGRSRKVRVVKYKNKTRYKRTLGHRQHFTEVQVEAVNAK